MRCGKADPGVKDAVLSPQGPPVTCFNCAETENEENIPLKRATPLPPPLLFRGEAAKDTSSSSSEQERQTEDSDSAAADEGLTDEEDLSEFLDASAEDVGEEVEETLSSSFSQLDTSAIAELLLERGETVPNAPSPILPATESTTITPDVIAESSPTGEAVGMGNRRRRAVSPLTEYRARVPERRSQRIASQIISLNPSMDSDGEDDGEFDAEPEDSDSEMEAQRPTPQLPRSKRAKKKTSGTQMEDVTWTKRDLPPEKATLVSAIPHSVIQTRMTLPDAGKMAPSEYFHLFFDEELYMLVLEQSHLYHDQKSLKCPKMTKQQFSKFVGFLLYAGCVSLPGKHYYWAPGTRQPCVAENFTSLEMKTVKAQLHFANNELNPEGHTFYKIEAFVNLLNKKFTDVVVEEPTVAVDEQMTVYKGTKCPTGLRQYMPNKPIAHGFKNWARGGISGYIYEMVFYRGQQGTVPTLERRSSRTSTADTGAGDGDEGTETKLKTAQVVLKLTANKPPGSFVYFDNLFASKDLCKILNEKGLNFVCTFRGIEVERCPSNGAKEVRERR